MSYRKVDGLPNVRHFVSVNCSCLSDAYVSRKISSLSVRIMACHLFNHKPSSNAMLMKHERNPWNIMQQ